MVRPVSSRASRVTASAAVSPLRNCPPGKHQWEGYPRSVANRRRTSACRAGVSTIPTIAADIVFASITQLVLLGCVRPVARSHRVTDLGSLPVRIQRPDRHAARRIRWEARLPCSMPGGWAPRRPLSTWSSGTFGPYPARPQSWTMDNADPSIPDATEEDH
jgi:hypothetical protein